MDIDSHFDVIWSLVSGQVWSLCVFVLCRPEKALRRQPRDQIQGFCRDVSGLFVGSLLGRSVCLSVKGWRDKHNLLDITWAAWPNQVCDRQPRRRGPRQEQRQT